MKKRDIDIYRDCVVGITAQIYIQRQKKIRLDQIILYKIGSIRE